MDDPHELVTCVVNEGEGRSTSLVAAAEAARAWLNLWFDYVRAAVAQPLRFIVSTSAASGDSPATPTLSENGRIDVHIAVPDAGRGKDLGLLRRHVFDQMLLGIELSAQLAPHRPPREVWLGPDPDDEEPDHIAGELDTLRPDEIMILLRIEDGDAGFARLELTVAQLMNVLDEFPGAGVADTFSARNTDIWIVSIK